MTVKSSISLTDQQDAFARRLVAKGRDSSLSAAIQHGLDLVQRDTDETEALRHLLQRRRQEPSISPTELAQRIAAMFKARRKERALEA